MSYGHCPMCEATYTYVQVKDCCPSCGEVYHVAIEDVDHRQIERKARMWSRIIWFFVGAGVIKAMGYLF